MKEIKELTGLYSLTKTIGVELKPVGKTQELVEAKKLIEQDDQRAEDYKIVKDIIDRYHKDFIDKCLNCVKIKKDDLEKNVSLAENSNRDAEDFDNIKTKMRNQITEAFRKNSLFTNLFKKNLIKEYLPAFVSEEEKSEYLELLSGNSATAEDIISNMYKTLDLITFYTGSAKECNAWSIQNGATAKEASGVIHTDFEHGFIGAEVVNVDVLIENGGWNGAKEKGFIKSVGKDYIVQDGDYMIVLANK